MAYKNLYSQKFNKRFRPITKIKNVNVIEADSKMCHLKIGDNEIISGK